MSAQTESRMTKQATTIARLLTRPRPPHDLVSMEGIAAPDRCVPAPDLVAWIRAAFLGEDAPLQSPDLAHLSQASIGALWTNAPNTRQQRQIVAQAEMPSRSLGNLGRWQRVRAEQQLREWFGVVPDFILTFDAIHAEDCDDRAWCCLVEHELRHCGQAMDEFGAPKFSRDTGLPVWAMRGHDVEAFAANAARYGIEALGPEATDFVIASARPREISDTQIAQACGTAPAKRRAAA